MKNCMTEFSFRSAKAYADPFNDVELDAVFTGPDGTKSTVPAFWAGENLWRVRFSSPLVGRHSYRTVCSDASNPDLHGREGVIEVTVYAGNNPLYEHGAIRVSENRRHLEHLDGTPFFWLADTWWLGLCKRLRWPEEFQLIASDRVRKGFSVIQIVAGLYPDMLPFDERGANESGFPWEQDYARIRPPYFDMADLRIGRLVDSGLVPCIVACWGYFIEFAGVQVMKKHWRYLVARWGAYPVVWCLAGEVLMPWYLKEFKDQAERRQHEQQTQAAWIEVARYLRSIDPYGHPITAHPGGRGSREIIGDDLADIEMLQTGHSGYHSVPNTVTQVVESVAQQPLMPVIDGEVSYEGIGRACRQEVQRFMFWVCMLSGAAGHSYGANGIWQFNRPEEPFGPSPHGMSWGDTPWQEAYRLPGSEHVGIGKRLLQRYEWWRLEPAPDSVQPHWTPQDYFLPYAAVIPGQCRIVFIPNMTPPLVKDLEHDVRYRAFWFDPASGREFEVGTVTADTEGSWQSPRPPLFQDWVLVLESVNG